MKLTTKIVLGLIASVFILSIGAIVGFSFTDRVNYNGSSKKLPSISQENMIEVDVKPYKTIVLKMGLKQDEEYIPLLGRFEMKPVTDESQKDKIFMPEELKEFTDIILSNDTLTLRLDLSRINEHFFANKSRDEQFYKGLSDILFVAYADSNAVDIASDWTRIDIALKDIETKSINISALSNIYVDNCSAEVLGFRNKGGRGVRLRNSKLKELNVDLDSANNWKVENCEVGVENLTGAGYHRIEQSKKESKVVNWHPKNKDARLQINIAAGDSLQVKFK